MHPKLHNNGVLQGGCSGFAGTGDVCFQHGVKNHLPERVFEEGIIGFLVFRCQSSTKPRPFCHSAVPLLAELHPLSHCDLDGVHKVPWKLNWLGILRFDIPASDSLTFQRNLCPLPRKLVRALILHWPQNSLRVCRG